MYFLSLIHLQLTLGASNSSSHPTGDRDSHDGSGSARVYVSRANLDLFSTRVTTLTFCAEPNKFIFPRLMRNRTVSKWSKTIYYHIVKSRVKRTSLKALKHHALRSTGSFHSQLWFGATSEPSEHLFIWIYGFLDILFTVLYADIENNLTKERSNQIKRMT